MERKKQSDFLNDIKLLIKFNVLAANVLPVITGFVLAIYITNARFYNYWFLFILALIGSTFVMAGALIINNWFDADIDSKMERTKKRPTVTGHFTDKQVLTLGIGTTALGFILLLAVNLETTLYAFIGWFTYVVLYTMWSKRKYTLNTIIGSISGAVTPLIGWAVVDSAVHPVPLTIFLLLFIWQIPHTFAIAIKRSEEYRAAGVPMLPVVYGFEMTKRQMLVYITCLLPLPFLIAQLGVLFIVIAAILNVSWIILALAGFWMKDVRKWAQWNFLYSVNYLVIIFLLLILATFPVSL
ncbi:Protoheme IX farnesyltransferase 2 [Oceanobacillus oncorhynchi]|uniref:Protoheme IX farnesyltransferase n=2 Tax=Oceanobacillus oncorhynchi TaxID=545501 RepID=A0A0A1MMT5_9BACI|nr:heme o synthase [Oceanobacillus oncorhynchi]CEI80987.1 Protoheme IX farnesyltransferase 2 [Oceanobacillus oncorhynchi]